MKNAQTPSTNTSTVAANRKQLENETYAAWVTAEGQEKENLYVRLHTLLVNHAQAVIFLILRVALPEVAAEAAETVLLNLESYRGDSAFTTWAHGIISNRIYDHRREERKRKETSVEVAGFECQDLPLGAVDLLLSIEETLDETEQNLFKNIVLEGLTHQEVADMEQVERSTVSYRWAQIVRRLEHALGK